MASIPEGKIVRSYSFIPGIDLSGCVVSSTDSRFQEGQQVLVTGYEVGVSHYGGFSEYARIQADWIVPLPAGLTLKEAMIYMVTGATDGVGGAAVSMLHKKGYQVVASTGKPDAADYLKSLTASEVISREDVAENSSKPLYVLCANAGVGPMATIEEMTAEDWDKMMNTNVRGALFSVQACLPFLKEAEYGRVVLTSSITGPVTGFAGWSHYGASKAAQLGFIRSAALELAFGITINAIMPGNTMTEAIQAQPEYIEIMLPAIPLKRFGTVEEMGHAATFLASKEAGFITGQTIIIDGGQSLPESSLGGF